MSTWKNQSEVIRKRHKAAQIAHRPLAVGRRNCAADFREDHGGLNRALTGVRPIHPAYVNRDLRPVGVCLRCGETGGTP